ncbi:DUF2087 domain-containing protein [Cohnella endophytica]|uniref:DUF2087 domain-containing protein n=1 Tax=Cohnella endophytica TaxID=2419778 RepID=A0A494Y251_9BACL|nr:DUF2087 domain-containing protein [Cohnella endophytica]RKP56837.1 DUF2087 domain-containing protein [Cohnella endophytica]
MSISDLFWNASAEQLKRGYVRDQDLYVCLLCGKTTEQGVVYPHGDAFYDAERSLRHHIEQIHGSVFEFLVGLDKKLTGLTEHQNSLLRLFFQGKSDAEVQKELSIGSASTIRNHRFVLKEKERQSKVFLTLMELLKDKDKHAPAIVPVHATARMVDERYNYTIEEAEQALEKYFPEGTEGPLLKFDIQEKHRLIVLREIAKRFKKDQNYTEKEVNRIIKTAYEDYAVIRRYLIEYGFMDREPDGSRYWLKD